LMKILGGVHQADAGSIGVDDKPVTIRHVNDAIRLGISFIHQELNVLDNLDVAGNVFLGREKLWGGPLRLIDRKTMNLQSRQYLERLGLQIDPSTPLIVLTRIDGMTARVKRHDHASISARALQSGDVTAPRLGQVLEIGGFRAIVSAGVSERDAGRRGVR